MGYEIEVSIAPKNVWYTPAEAKAYYGKYSRDYIAIHWWGDGTGADNHDNIVNYFMRRKDGSVNYVVSDKKITKMVEPDNVAWTTQSGNPVSISIEHQPTLGDEGYKRSGWLVAQLESIYGRTLEILPHSYWFATACPGTIDIGRIREEADKVKREGDMAVADDDFTKWTVRNYWGRAATQQELDSWRGTECYSMTREFANSPQRLEYAQRVDEALKAFSTKPAVPAVTALKPGVYEVK